MNWNWNWSWKRKRSQEHYAESATSLPKAEQTTGDSPPARGEQHTEDNSDHNDKFWKLFLDEAKSEAQRKVKIWHKELDSLLVFAGLFAGVVSAFLVDLRFHLRPDPQVLALRELASILRNDTAPVEAERPTKVIIATGFLWYGSLMVTLIGALWGVLAKGWLGDILRETPKNPAESALERWRRDKATRDWHMDNVMTAVPLLIQVGLAMFLTGFVVQSFDDYRDIGIFVLVYVILGACAYALFTLLPWFYPNCPYQTPLTTFLHLVRPDTDRTVISKDDDDSAKAESKMTILTSRLNRLSNDDIFCSAVSLLDAKLESHESDKWYKGVVLHEKASDIAEALSVRLKSFAPGVQTIPEGSSLSIPNDTASSDSTSGQTLVGALYSPIERSVTCLRILLKSIEFGISSEVHKSPWTMIDIDPRWRIANTFPEAWRLLSLSIHITSLVARKVDHDTVDIAAIDWDNMIRKTFSDVTVRSNSGLSACRGLLQGKNNLKRVCAVGLAMFIEIGATPSLEQVFGDYELVEDTGEVITKTLWSELVNIWKDSMLQLLSREFHGWDELGNSLIDSELLTKKLYQSDIESFISQNILAQLTGWYWATREQAVRMLTKLSKQDVFHGVMNASGVIPTVISMLNDRDDDVRDAVVEAWSAFGEQNVFTGTMIKEKALPQIIAALMTDDSDVQAAAVEIMLKFSESHNQSYQDNIKPAIPIMLKQLEQSDWGIRAKIIQILINLSERGLFNETPNNAGTNKDIVPTLANPDPDVRTAAVEAWQAFSIEELYEESIRSFISTIVKQLDNESWEIRQQNVQFLTKLSENAVFNKTMNGEGTIEKIVAILADPDPRVRAAAVKAWQAFSTEKPYEDNIKSSISAVIKQLVNESWEIRQQSVQILMKLSENAVFNKTMSGEGTIEKIVAILVDPDSDVRTAAVEAWQAFSIEKLYEESVKSSIPTLIKQLDKERWEIRQQNVQILMKLSENAVFNETMNGEGTVEKIVATLADSDTDVQAAAIQALQAFSKEESYQKNIKLSILTTMEQLDSEDWRVRQQAVQTLVQLFAFEEFRKTLNTEGMIPKIYARLKDNDSDVRDEAIAALQGFSSDESYYSNLKSSIPTIINQLDDENGEIRKQAIGILKAFAMSDVFQTTLKPNEIAPKLISMLKDKDEGVRIAAVDAVSALCTQQYFMETMNEGNGVSALSDKLLDDNSSVRFATFQAMPILSTHEMYRKEMNSKVSVSAVIKQLKNQSWISRQQAVQTLSQLAANVAFQVDINTNNTVSKVATIFTNDNDDDVRIASAQALLVFGEQESFREALRSEKVILKLAAKLSSDSFSSVRDVVQSTILAFSKKEFYQNDIKSAIPTFLGQLADSRWTTWAVREQAIQTLEKLSEQPVFHETLKTESYVAKLVAKLEDGDEDVRAAAAHALSTLGTLAEDPFKERMKAEKAIPRLIAKLMDDNDKARNAVREALLALGKLKGVAGFLQTAVSALNTVEKPVRTEVYKLLAELKETRDSDDFFKEIDTAICELLIQMKDKDISFIRRSIAILTETADEGLRGGNLQSLNPANGPARDAVKAVVRSKLVYEKNSPDRNDVILTLSRLAKHDVFQGSMRSAIPALIEAVGSNDPTDWSITDAFEAISTLSKTDYLRADLVAIVQKLIQKLSGGDDDSEAYSFGLIKTLTTLTEYKEFQSKLKHVVPILMEKLQKDLCNDTLDQDSDTNKIIFYQEACKLICTLCEDMLGRELVPHLTRVLPNMHASLAKDLLAVVAKLIEKGNLTMNDRIALASSLRILSSAPDNLEVQVCKLTIAALLDDAHNFGPLYIGGTEYGIFFGAILGKGNSAIISKLSSLHSPSVDQHQQPEAVNQTFTDIIPVLT